MSSASHSKTTSQICISLAQVKFCSFIHVNQTRCMKNDGMFGAQHSHSLAVGSLGALLRMRLNSN